MTEAEIAGYMGWRGPGAYTQHQMRKIKEIVEEVQRREREACARIAWNFEFDEIGPIEAAIRARGQE